MHFASTDGRPVGMIDTGRRCTLHVQENEYAGAASAPPVLFVEEAERFVEDLREFSLDEVGGSR